jgi:dipeptidyl aminopeptidase/acylaminoacyl peptidase
MSSIPGLIKHYSARRARGALLLSIFLTLALSACGGGGGSVFTFNQTPASPSGTSTPAATPTPRPGSAFAYAFARNGQVWVAQAGKAAQQLSNLPTSSFQNISALAWSPDGKHLAFEATGVGNPVDYLIDASSGNLTALNVPSTSSTASFGWADNNTVVAIKHVGGNTQFWKVNITDNTSSQVTQVNGSPQAQVLKGSIYYSEFDSTSKQMMLHRFDLGANSEGTPVAITPAGTSTLKVNWDVSPDGSRVLTGFKLATPDASWGNGFWDINFNDDTDRIPIFTNDEIPFSSFTDNDTITLSFSPDGQTVFLDTQNSVGPATEGVDDSRFTIYSPHVGISSPTQITWAPNSASFALTSDGNASQPTFFTVGNKTAGSAFIDNASLLQWAPKS